MRRCLTLLALLAALPAGAGELVSRPGPGEQETLHMVGVRTATGPLLNIIEPACAPVMCAAGQCALQPAAMVWEASAGERRGVEATLLCHARAMVSGLRATAVPVAGGTAVQSFALRCGPLAAIAADGAITGMCRDRGVSAFSVAVGACPQGAGGQGEHVRALSAFRPGLVQ